MKKFLCLIFLSFLIGTTACSLNNQKNEATNNDNSKNTYETKTNEEKDKSLLLTISVKSHEWLFGEYKDRSAGIWTWEDMRTKLFWDPDIEVLAHGYGCEGQYSDFIDRLQSQRRDNYIIFSENDKKTFQKGVRRLENEVATKSNKYARSTLAKFYYGGHADQNISKGLNWAYKAAEHGESKGMLILTHAYAEGTGVPQDLEESIKWLLLTRRTGDPTAKWIIETIERYKSSQDYKRFCEIKQQAFKKAETWAKEHPDAFFALPEEKS